MSKCFSPKESRKSATYALRIILMFCTTAMILGCGSNEDQSYEETTSQDLPNNHSAAIDFSDRKWVFVDSLPWNATGRVFRPGMTAAYYTTGENDVRLIELVYDESSNLEFVYSRLLITQIMVDGKWINHGPTADWLLNGERGESNYAYGKIHGTQRAWYSNGQLKLEREWVNDEMRGRERAWHENGQLKYQLQNFDDVETDIKEWDVDGNRIR